jgi:hypothetical protein
MPWSCCLASHQSREYILIDLCNLAEFFFQDNYDGKGAFIGCNKWSKHTESATNKHRLITIPLDIHEALVKEIFQSHGRLGIATLKQYNEEVDVAKNCSTLIPRRNFKNRKQVCRTNSLLHA